MNFSRNEPFACERRAVISAQEDDIMTDDVRNERSQERIKAI